MATGVHSHAQLGGQVVDRAAVSVRVDFEEQLPLANEFGPGFFAEWNA